MTQEEFNERLKQNRHMAAAHAAAVLENPRDFQSVYRHTRGYLFCKYFLDEAETDEDDIIRLGNLGSEKLANLRKGGLEFVDKSVGCTSVASSVTKKALLVLSLGKALGLQFDPDRIAETLTVTQWAQLIQEQLTRSKTT